MTTALGRRSLSTTGSHTGGRTGIGSGSISFSGLRRRFGRLAAMIPVRSRSSTVSTGAEKASVDGRRWAARGMGTSGSGITNLSIVVHFRRRRK